MWYPLRAARIARVDCIFNWSDRCFQRLVGHWRSLVIHAGLTQSRYGFTCDDHWVWHCCIESTPVEVHVVRHGQLFIVTLHKVRAAYQKQNMKFNNKITRDGYILYLFQYTVTIVVAERWHVHHPSDLVQYIPLKISAWRQGSFKMKSNSPTLPASLYS